ncbi:MAG: CSLREA domain-containing protein [Chloroflexi bacterium]|nr:CSLREA domain-containing protein [Chloroflexota bacterium]
MIRKLLVVIMALFVAIGSSAQAPDDSRGTPKGPRRVFPVQPRAGVPRTPPANDAFASPTVITPTLPYTDTVVDFDQATGEVDEPLDCFTDTISVWYSLTPTENMVITLNTEGSSFDTVLAVYTGAALATLTSERCNDDFSVVVDAGFSSTITGLSVSAGTTYMIRIGAFDNGLLLAGDSSILNIKPTPAAAALTVNSTVDAVDANIGDGVCATSGAVCTLRAAINEANASQPGSTIAVPAGTYLVTINAPVDPGNPNALLYEDAAINGDLDLVSSVTITGAGAQTTIVDGGALDTVMEFFTGANVTLSGVTIRNGSRPGNQSAGGGLRINETAVVTANSIWITDNDAVFGGGLTVEGGTLTLTNSAITGNTATGKTFINDPDPNSYIAGNGGGIEVRDSLGVDATITLTNVTISGNSAVAPDASVTSKGGGVYFGLPQPSTNLSVALNNVTIAVNTAARGGGIFSDMVAPDIELDNTLIADNTAPTNPDCKGDIGSTGSNFVEAETGCITVAGDLVGQLPFLDPLKLNAPGSTPTQLIRNASPARENGDPATCASTDQRGITRPQGPVCDIGAMEAVSAVPGSFGLIDPAENTIIPSSTGLAELSWAVSSNALYYVVSLDNISGSSPVNVFVTTVAANVACTTECSIDFTQPLADGFYRYSVAAHNDSATTPASPTHIFQVDSVAGLPSLIANGGFEALASKGQPASWKFVYLSDDKRKCNTVDVTVAYEGSCSYLFKGSKHEKMILKQKIDRTGLTIVPGDKFRLTFFASAGGTVVAKAQLKVVYTKASLTTSKLKITIPIGNKTYVPYIGDVTVTDSRVDRVIVQFNNSSASGKWYLDQVRVVYLSSVPRNTRDEGLLPPPPAPNGFRGQN